MKKLFVFSLVIALVFLTVPAKAVNISNDLGMYFYSNKIPVTQGNYWFVCSAGSSDGAGSDSYPGDNPRQPLATIDAAINKCTAGSTTYPGDVIVVMPGHAETVTGTTDLVPDTAGIYIIGLGEGDMRPTITLSTNQTASILISGADTTFENLVFENDCTNLSEMFDLGADDITFRNCVLQDDGNSCLIFMMADGANTADNLTIDGCLLKHATSSAVGDCGISAESAQDGWTIRNTRIIGDMDVAPLYADEAMTNATIVNCYLENVAADQYAIEWTHTSNTGFFVDNLLYTDDYATAMDCDDMRQFGNKFSMGVDMAPIDIPATGSNVGAGPILVYVQSGSTTTIVDERLCAYPNDYFTAGWVATVTQDAGGASAAPQGQTRDISDFVGSTGTITVGTAFSAAPGAGDQVILTYDPLRAVASDTSDAVDMSQEIPNNSILANILDDGGVTANYDRRYCSLLALNTDLDTIIVDTSYLTDNNMPTSPTTRSIMYYIGRYLSDGDGDWAAGQQLPANKSLFDIIGDEYTDDGGGDNLDSVAAHINYISRWFADGTGDFASGTRLPSNKSILDALGATGIATMDDANTIAGMIGYNDNNNAFNSDAVVPNVNGSVLERTEALFDGMEITYNSPRFIDIDTNFSTSDKASVATHELLTVTGDVRLRCLFIVRETLTDSTNVAQLTFGTATDTNCIITYTLTDQLAANDFWKDASPTEACAAVSTVLDTTVCNGEDVGYEIHSEAITGGQIRWYFWWTPISSDGVVAEHAGAGTASL